ncbi:MAG: cadmium-translocating P-type ATPase [Firmicutes bacterium]|nr:cadmium-translocating P-type ATPase [Bacillota bacterium]
MTVERVDRKGVAWELDGELRPLLAATVLSAAFLVLGWVLERPALGLPPWAAILAYALSYVTGGYLRVREGLEALREGSLSIDLLMVLGAAGAAALGRWSEGAVLIFLFALSNTLEEFAAGRTRRAIQALMTLRPDSARVRRPDGREEEVPVERLAPGDLVLVRPGERLPADGEVVEGRSAVDQSPITGESVPVEKAPGDPVFAGTVNGGGLLVVRVTRPASESTLARVIRLVEEAQEHKARVQRMTEWIDRYYTLAVVAVALAVLLVPPLALGWDWGRSFYLAMQLLVVMSPCALVIATPAALLSAIAAGARQGILFKGGVHLEQAGRIAVVALDKTGTLTEGRPRVQAVEACPGMEAREVLRLAAAAELHSTHPLARAVVAAAEAQGLVIPEPEEVREEPGCGVTARVEGREVRVGSLRFVAPEEADGWLARTAAALESRGQTAVLVAVDGRPVGAIGLADGLRPGAAEAVAALRRAGVRRVVMLTGDNERVAAAVAAQVGVDEYRAGLLPGEKLEAIRELERRYGPVAMVGDGVNDAPALAAATLGVAMGGAGNDAALESADVVLMSDELHRLPEAFRLGRRARQVVAQNLAFAVGVIVVLVAFTLAGSMTLPLAVVGHEGSTILVALSGLRLLLGSGSREGRRGRGQKAGVDLDPAPAQARM